MPIFRLLLKNAWRIIKKSKILMIQLTAIVFLAGTIVSSIFLSNQTLKKSYDNVEELGNAPDASISEFNVANNAGYDLKDENKVDINSNGYKGFGWADVQAFQNPNEAKIYNPYVTTSVPILDPIDQNKTLQTYYGFYKIYEDNNQNPNIWNNLVKTINEDIISINTTLTNQIYKNKLQNAFSFYKNVFSPSEQDVTKDKSILYNLSIYQTNPWSINCAQDGFGISDFGIARLSNFYNSKKFSFSTGIIYNNLGLLIGTDKAMSPITKDEAININNGIVLNTNVYNFFSSPSLINSSFQLSKDLTSFNWNVMGYITPYISQQYFEFNNKMINELTNNYFINSPGYLKVNYNLSSNKSNKTVKLIHDLWEKKLIPDVIDPNATTTNCSDPNKLSSFFNGTIQIPLIPYLTLKVTNPNLFDPTNPDTWKNNSEIDNAKVNNIISESLNTLSNKTIKACDRVYNNIQNDPKYKTYINKYKETYDIDYFLDKLKVQHESTRNFTTNSLSSDNFIFSSAPIPTLQKPNVLNKLVIKDGSGLIQEELNSQVANNLINDFRSILDNWTWQNDYWVVNQPWEQQRLDRILNFYKFLSHLEILDSDANANSFYSTLNELLNIPKPPFDPNVVNKYKQIRDEFFREYKGFTFKWTGFGIQVEIKRQTINGVIIQVNSKYVDRTSYLCVVSENYEQFKNNNKKVLPTNILEQALRLPFKQKYITIEELNNNPEKYADNWIINPVTNKPQFYNDFLSWLSDLNESYKIKTSSSNSVIIGSGINPEFIYPISSTSDFLVNNNNPVIFGNNSFYNMNLNYINTPSNSTIWLKFNTNSIIEQNKLLSKINDWTQNLFQKNLAFRITDPNQTNQLLYKRMNFPIQIMNTVFTLTIILAVVIGILSLFFISTLLRSIVKQNISIIAISISNGISKLKTILSMIYFALIPSLLSWLLAIGISQLIFPIINSSISSYWILQWQSTYFSYGLIILLPIITFIILFATLSIVLLITMRKDTTTLLSSRVEFRMNKLIVLVNPLLRLLTPLASFRLSYIMGNVTRFLVLWLMMTFFITTSSIFVSSMSVFDNSVKQTLKNRNYNFAIDLTSPSVQGGYYNDIPYDQIGTASKGLAPNLTFSPVGTYNGTYKPYFTYVNPQNPPVNYPNVGSIPQNNNDFMNLQTYNSLFCISTDLTKEILNNIQFFRNRILSRNILDINVNFLGNNINPWNFAKDVMPSNVINLADDYFQKTTTTAFKYYIYIDQNINNKKLDWERSQKMWLMDKQQGTLLSDITDPKTQKIITNPELWNQSNWVFQYKKNSQNIYEWVLNNKAVLGLPTFELKKSVVQLWINILSLYKNPNFADFKNLNKDKDLFNSNFLLGLNVVPIVKDKNETYTYLNTQTNLNNENLNLRILGIKPDSKFINLYDEYSGDKDLKTILADWDKNNPDLNKVSYYPLIINEVTFKKFNLKVNDIIESQILNTYDRYINKFNNIPQPKVKFKVLGVTTSKTDVKLYTSQTVANKLLNYTKPGLATEADIKNGNYDNKWLSQKDIDSYVPFNGVFSLEENPVLLSTFASIYSISGLTPLSGSLPEYDSSGDAATQLKNSWIKLNKILHLNIIDYTQALDTNTFNKFLKTYRSVFDNDRYINLSINNLDVIQINKILGKTLDNTVSNIMLIIIIAFLPTLLIIVSLLALMIVIESKRLISLLKVLGFGNISNTFTLTISYFILLILSLLTSIGLTALILYLFQTLTFTFFNIIINPVLIPWIFAATGGLLLFFIIFIWIGIYINLRKTNVAEVISIR